MSLSGYKSIKVPDGTPTGDAGIVLKDNFRYIADRLEALTTAGVSGYSGMSGFSGYSGLSGQSGTSGRSGYSGFSGYSGTSGKSGANGMSGFSGWSGAAGGGGTLSALLTASPWVGAYSPIADAGAQGIGNVKALQFAGSGGIAGVYPQLWSETDEGRLIWTDPDGVDYFVRMVKTDYSGTIPYGDTYGGGGASGISGFSGFSGAAGVSGFSGVSGRSGYSGITGASGYSGTAGISGLSGQSGVSGYSGTSGTSGRSGYSGASGYSGQVGTSGTSGTKGVSGFSGWSGMAGSGGSAQDLGSVLVVGNDAGGNDIINLGAVGASQVGASNITTSALEVQGGGITGCQSITNYGSDVYIGDGAMFTVSGDGAGNVTCGNIGAGAIAASTLSTSGSVGVGTSSPATKVHVVGSLAESNTTLENVLVIEQPYQAGHSFAHACGIALGGSPSNSLLAAAMHLRVQSGSAGVSHLATIATLVGDSGNVGIGTASPSYKLQVNGTAAATGFLHPSGYFTLDSAAAKLVRTKVDSALVYDQRSLTTNAGCTSISASGNNVVYSTTEIQRSTFGWVEATVTIAETSSYKRAYLRKRWSVSLSQTGGAYNEVRTVETTTDDPNTTGTTLNLVADDGYLAVRLNQTSAKNINVSFKVEHKFDYSGQGTFS